MKQLGLFKDLKGKEIQLRKRPATTLIPSSACSEVTSCVKPEGGSSWAAGDKPKVLSPEITIIGRADKLHFLESSMAISAKGKEIATSPGSEAVAREQKDSAGTRETRSIPQNGVWTAKPINGKAIQTMLWESDQPIVASKQGNACRAKELIAVFWEGRDTSSTLRGGKRKSTKFPSLSFRARENPQLRFTSLAHMLTVDFLKECFRELKRNKAPGVDRGTVKEYGKNLEENLKDLVEKMKRRQYRPQPVKRVYIPKPKGGRRPLGIPTVEDKIVQEVEPKYVGAEIIVGVRPQQIKLYRAKKEENTIPGSVRIIEFQGNKTVLTMKLGDENNSDVKAVVSATEKYNKGDTVWLYFSPDVIHLFDKETERPLIK